MSFTCPVCLRTSRNRQGELFGYCVFCDAFTRGYEPTEWERFAGRKLTPQEEIDLKISLARKLELEGHN